MYQAIKRCRINHKTYQPGELVEVLPDDSFSYLFEKVEKKKKKVKGKKVETASIERGEKR